MNKGSSEAEKNLLLELIVKNKQVVFDETTNLSKGATKEIWSGITERFNASGIGPPKTSKQLKLMWRHIKRKVHTANNIDEEDSMTYDESSLLYGDPNLSKVLSMISSHLTPQETEAGQRRQRRKVKRPAKCCSSKKKTIQVAKRNGPTSPSPPVGPTSADTNPPLSQASSLSPLAHNKKEAQPSTSDNVQDNTAAAAPPRKLRKRTRPFSTATDQEQSYEDVMHFKCKEHELEMKIKDTNYQCSEMEKELKTINKQITMIDNEVKEMQLKLSKLEIRNTELQYQILKKEMENANEKGHVLRMWGDAAVAVKDAAQAFTKSVKHMND